jgi:predicted TIM-barrel fold metal-dependent hydrolase
VQTIDADAHVIETEETWEFMEPEDRRYRPTVVAPPESPERTYWLIDGQIRGFQGFRFRAPGFGDGSSRNTVTPEGARDMTDIEVRVHHMDQLGIDIQVLHNTIFIKQLTDRPAVDVALCRAWNRWLAHIWKEGQGRLRWSLVPPLLSIADALEEMRFGKANGAVGVLMRPIEGHHPLADPYFYPIYEEASRLDLPIIVHIGNANPWLTEFWQNDPAFTFAQFRVPTVQACYSIIMSEIPRVFPMLRWGFIEASAQWLPWILREARSRHEMSGKEFPENALHDYRIYVTCQNDDDIPWVIKHAGTDNLVIGTDYGHFDPSTEIDAISLLKEKSGLPQSTIQTILSTNPKTLYAL